MFEIVYHPDYGELNKLDQPKPFFETYESPLRCKITWEHLKQIGFVSRDFRGTRIQTNTDRNLVIKKPEPLTKDDIRLVHSRYHLEMVERFTEFGCGQLGNSVLATEDTMEIALLSAGGAYEAISDVFNNKYSQSFALIRPPGHHAMPGTPDGLCIFNNIAVSIAKLRKDNKFNGKIAIIDIDAHYGNGLAEIFYEDPDVLYTSIHEMDFMMGEDGFFGEIGFGDGLGYNICFPVRYGSGDIVLKKYCNFIEPFLNDFSPDLIIIASGFDGHWADPIGNLNYTSKGYKHFANWIKAVSSQLCGGKVAFCLEGGYNLIMLPRLIETVISQFVDAPKTEYIDDYPQKVINKQSYADELFAERHNDQVDALKKRLERIWRK